MADKVKISLNLFYHLTFPFDGLDVHWGAVNGREVDVVEGNRDNKVERAYAESLLIRVASFFGLPTRMRKNGQATIGNILRRLFFVPEISAPPWQMGLQILAMLTLIPFAFNVLSALLSTFAHTVMLVTELLPATLLFGTGSLILKLRDADPANNSPKLQKNKISAILTLLAKIGLIVVGLSATLAWFVGRAITSPIANISAMLSIKDLGVGRYFVAALSGAITIAAYTLLFPLGAKLFIANVVPFVSAQLPAIVALASQLAAVFSPVISAIASAMTTVGTAIPFLGAFATTVGVSPLWPALGAAVSTIVAIFGFPINYGVNVLLNKFFTNEKKNDFLPFDPEMPTRSTYAGVHRSFSIPHAANNSGRTFVGGYEEYNPSTPVYVPSAGSHSGNIATMWGNGQAAYVSQNSYDVDESDRLLMDTY
jgi:hypothetical protein